MRKWTDINKDLNGKLDLEKVKTREQGGTVIPYLPGEFVIDTLNGVFGADGWSSDLMPLDTKEFEGGNYTLYMFRCTLTLRGLNEAGEIVEVHKTDVGRNLVNLGEKNYQGKEYSPGVIASNNDMSFAGAATDALKRAARHLGNPFGLTLYDKDSEDFKTVTSSASKPRSRSTGNTRPATKRTTSRKDAPKTEPKQEAPAPKVDTSSLTPQSVLDFHIPAKVGNVVLPVGDAPLKDIINLDVAYALLGWIGGKQESPGGAPKWVAKSPEEKVLQATTLYAFENFEEVKKASLA